MRPGKQAAIEILRHVQDTSEVGPRKRLGVMIVAENASLRQGGESSLAIQWFRGLLKAGVDVRLLVHVCSKLELDQSLSKFSSRIHYVPDVPLQKICWKFGEALPDHVRDFTVGWLVHLITQFMQRRAARRLIEQYKIDIVHEPTPVGPRMPSMMYGLGVPVVIGPMNGNMTYPPGYSSRSFLERAFVPVARGFADLPTISFQESGGRRCCWWPTSELDWRCPRAAGARWEFFARTVWSRMSGGVPTICRPARSRDCVWLSWAVW